MKQLKSDEEEKKIEEQTKREIEIKVYDERLIQIYKGFSELNKMEVAEQGFLDFAKLIDEIAA